MNKNEKKTEKAIVNSLNDVCESLKIDSSGFSWLTHFVDYPNFPNSLKLVFVFDTTDNLKTAKNTALTKSIIQLTETRLKKNGVLVKQIEDKVFFDTEDQGADFNDLKWCRKYS